MGGRRGLVPTMGALHDGHLSLVRHALSRCDEVVVSVFVNPTQFGPSEDFDAYPRQLEHDEALLMQLEGAERLRFAAPSVSDIYPDGVDGATRIVVPDISTILCGASRPDFLVGAASVVYRLCQRYTPNEAYFGEKDYQQLMVMQKMASDLAMPVTIIGCPIVREKSGLAMSSRNQYLSPEDTVIAAGLYEELKCFEGDVSLLKDNAVPLSHIKQRLELRGFNVDYVAVEWGRLLAAVNLHGVRLIDNVPLKLN